MKLTRSLHRIAVDPETTGFSTISKALLVIDVCVCVCVCVYVCVCVGYMIMLVDWGCSEFGAK